MARPKDLTRGEEEKEAMEEWNRLRYENLTEWGESLGKPREADGDAFVVTEEACECGGQHYEMVVQRNVSPIWPPLCPMLVVLRRMRRALGSSGHIDRSLSETILKAAAFPGVVHDL